MGSKPHKYLGEGHFGETWSTDMKAWGGSLPGIFKEVQQGAQCSYIKIREEIRELMEARL